jgi:hypothetical protein
MGAHAQSADVPNWRTHDTWQYNVSIADYSGNHRVTIRIAGWGEYLDQNNNKFETFEVIYSTNIAIYNDTYGVLEIRDRDLKGITRTEYKTTFSRQHTNYTYQFGFENYSVRKVTDYSTMLNSFGFPLQVGKSWNQAVTSDITTQVEIYKPTGLELSVENESRNLNFYYQCTEIRDILLNSTDNMETLLDPSIEANWTRESVSTFVIVQDDEEADTDGTFTVDYYNITKGNIVRREIWEEGELNVTWSLVFTDYIYSEDPFVPPEQPDEDSPEVFVCLSGIALLAVLLLAFLIIRKRSIPKEERFTKEYVEAVDTKTELIELCEEAKLSTKGSKSQLRKRLLAYVADLERDEQTKKQTEEDFEDDAHSEVEQDLEEDIDELALEDVEEEDQEE